MTSLFGRIQGTEAEEATAAPVAGPTSSALGGFTGFSWAQNPNLKHRKKTTNLVWQREPESTADETSPTGPAPKRERLIKALSTDDPAPSGAHKTPASGASKPSKPSPDMAARKNKNKNQNPPAPAGDLSLRITDAEDAPTRKAKGRAKGQPAPTKSSSTAAAPSKAPASRDLIERLGLASPAATAVPAIVPPVTRKNPAVVSPPTPQALPAMPQAPRTMPRTPPATVSPPTPPQAPPVAPQPAEPEVSIQPPEQEDRNDGPSACSPEPIILAIPTQDPTPVPSPPPEQAASPQASVVSPDAITEDRAPEPRADTAHHEDTAPERAADPVLSGSHPPADSVSANDPDTSTNEPSAITDAPDIPAAISDVPMAAPDAPVPIATEQITAENAPVDVPTAVDDHVTPDLAADAPMLSPTPSSAVTRSGTPADTRQSPLERDIQDHLLPLREEYDLLRRCNEDVQNCNAAAQRAAEAFTSQADRWMTAVEAFVRTHGLEGPGVLAQFPPLPQVVVPAPTNSRILPDPSGVDGGEVLGHANPRDQSLRPAQLAPPVVERHTSRERLHAPAVAYVGPPEASSSTSAQTIEHRPGSIHDPLPSEHPSPASVEDVPMGGPQERVRTPDAQTARDSLDHERIIRAAAEGSSNSRTVKQELLLDDVGLFASASASNGQEMDQVDREIQEQRQQLQELEEKKRVLQERRLAEERERQHQQEELEHRREEEQRRAEEEKERRAEEQRRKIEEQRRREEERREAQQAELRQQEYRRRRDIVQAEKFRHQQEEALRLQQTRQGVNAPDRPVTPSAPSAAPEPSATLENAALEHSTEESPTARSFASTISVGDEPSRARSSTAPQQHMGLSPHGPPAPVLLTSPYGDRSRVHSSRTGVRNDEDANQHTPSGAQKRPFDHSADSSAEGSQPSSAKKPRTQSSSGPRKTDITFGLPEDQSPPTNSMSAVAWEEQPRHLTLNTSPESPPLALRLSPASANSPIQSRPDPALSRSPSRDYSGPLQDAQSATGSEPSAERVGRRASNGPFRSHGSRSRALSPQSGSVPRAHGDHWSPRRRSPHPTQRARSYDPHYDDGHPQQVAARPRINRVRYVPGEIDGRSGYYRGRTRSPPGRTPPRPWSRNADYPPQSGYEERPSRPMDPSLADRTAPRRYPPLQGHFRERSRSPRRGVDYYVPDAMALAPPPLVDNDHYYRQPAEAYIASGSRDPYPRGHPEPPPPSSRYQLPSYQPRPMGFIRRQDYRPPTPNLPPGQAEPESSGLGLLSRIDMDHQTRNPQGTRARRVDN